MKESSVHYQILNYKYLPLHLRKLILILMNWFFQGILYMDNSELLFKVSLTLIPFFILLNVFVNSFPIVLSVVLSFFISHTLNWTLNGQVFVLLKNINSTKTRAERFTKYLDNLQSKVYRDKSILSVAAYGSLSRNQIKETSDLDIRIVRKKGIINGIRACIFVFAERKWAFLNKFPLDIYLLDDTNDLLKLDEQPVILYDPLNLLFDYYNGKVIYWK
jgi:predicted nucleotidyltransferase